MSFIVGFLNTTSPTAPTLLTVSTARTAQGSRTTSCTMYQSQLMLHPRSTYHPTGRTCPLLPNTRHLPASDLICWNPTCWCASGISFRYLTSASSTTASTRCSGLRIYAITVISSAFYRRDTALTYLINRKCGNIDT